MDLEGGLRKAVGIIDNLIGELKKVEEKREEDKESDDSIELAWGLIANVSEGDWTKQKKDWQDAAAKWRDEVFGINKIFDKKEEKKECKVLFGMEILTNNKIPHGTMCLAHKREDGVIVVDSIENITTEEKKTLSDKITYAFMLQSGNDLILMGNPSEENKKKYIEEGCIPVADVKEAIKEFIEDLGNTPEEEIMEERERRQKCGGEGRFNITFRNIAKGKAKERFGDRLI